MSGNTMAGAPATTEGAVDERELNYSFTGRVALTVVFVLFGLTVVIIIMRVLLYVLVYRSGRGRGSGGGGGGLAAGFLRSINSFGRMGSRRHGLDASALSALPVTAFRKEAGSTSASAAGLDCAVCLSELADGDTVRQLPNCGHVFHVECVDAWLRTTTTCPLCRSEAELSRGKAEAAAPSSSSSSGTGPPQPTLLGAGGSLIVTVHGGSADTQRDVRR